MEQGIHKKGITLIDFLGLVDFPGPISFPVTQKLYVLAGDLYYDSTNISSLLGSLNLWTRDALSNTISPNTPNDNLDIGTGIFNSEGFTDSNAVIPVNLGDVSNTILDPSFTYQSILGALNELKTTISTISGSSLFYTKDSIVITSLTGDGALITATTALPHGLASLDSVYLNGWAGSLDTQLIEVDLIPDSGTWTITFDDGVNPPETTGLLNYNDDALAIQSALELLTNIGAGNIAVSGDLVTAGATLTFLAPLGNANLPLVTANVTGLLSGVLPVTETISKTIIGSSGIWNGLYQVTVTGPTEFTYSSTGNGFATGGTCILVINNDIVFTDVIASQYKCEDLIIENSSGTAVTIDIGTTLGGTEISSALVCPAGSLQQISINQLFSATANTSFYVASGSWTTAYLNMSITSKRVMY